MNSVHLIGNAHLDPAWLWRWQEGFAEIKATFRSALDRMEEDPDFIFTCSAASYYQWIERNAPEMFAEIQRRVREDRWAVVGGMWVQPDCNLPAGESFCRHLLYSQRYLKRVFGRICTTGYNVDSFGHAASLPKILARGGIRNYVYMRPGSHEKTDLPARIFNWACEDGSSVLAGRITTHYGHLWEAPAEGDAEEQKIERSLDEARGDGMPIMNFYGVGNHGGGPTIGNLRMIHARMDALEPGELMFSSPDSFFDDVRSASPDLPTVQDELHHHARGCYSANSAVKQLNRRAEQRAIQAEKLASLAHMTGQFACDPVEIATAWEQIMFNQFHDILCGCSVPGVYDDATESYGHALNISARLRNHAAQHISWLVDTRREELPRSKEHDWILWGDSEVGTPVVVFNSHSWDAEVRVEIGWEIEQVMTDAGDSVPLQRYRASYALDNRNSGTVFLASVPAFGYRLYWMKKGATPIASGGRARADLSEGIVVENDRVRLSVSPVSGGIESLVDKATGRSIAGPNPGAPVVMDVEPYDTWGHGTESFRTEIGRFAVAGARVVEDGPVRSVVAVTSEFGSSRLEQQYVVYRDSPDLEVHVQLDWHETFAVLKLPITVAVDDPVTCVEIPYGFARRIGDGAEDVMQKWVAIVDEDRPLGLAIASDGRCSYDSLENEIRLTVANSSLFADHIGVRDGDGRFLDQGRHEFSYRLIPIDGENWIERVSRRAEELNTEPVFVIETYHDGPLGPTVAGVNVSPSNAQITALKRAEDGGAFVVRLVETSGHETTAEVALPLLGRTWTTSLASGEIKTFRIPDDPASEVAETSILEMDS